MRFFVALEIPEENRAQLREVQTQIKHLLPQIRLTDNDKLHLTLAFVGEEPDTLKDQLTHIIQDAAVGISPFEVTPAYLDGFPNIHYPHTLWVGVKGDIDKLLIIRERIKDRLKELSLVVDERRFIPHIAIAKLSNSEVSTKLETSLQKIMAVHFDPIRISSIKLFESVPDQGFHTHNTLTEILLK